MIKRIAFLTAVLFFLLPLTGCGAAKPPSFGAIKTYTDIVGVTQTEIAAIEALKAGRSSFTYGAVYSTEAFEKPDGEKAGFSLSLCALLSDLFGIDFVLEIYNDKAGLMQGVDNGSADFTGEWTAARAKGKGYINSISIAERMLRIYTHKDSVLPEINTETDIINLTIGFLADTATAATIQNIYPVVFTAETVADYDEAKAKLISGDIDAFLDEAIADPVFESPDFTGSPIFFPLVYSPVSLAVKNPALEPFITVFNKYLIAGGVDKMHKFYKDGDLEYAQNKLYNSFSPQEKAYVDGLKARNGSVAVAYEHDNYPVNFYNDKDREFQGMAVDVLAEIGALIGVNFEPAVSKNTSWSEIMATVKAGKIPMAGQILQDEDRAKYFIWSEVPYGRSNYAFTSKYNYPDLASYQVVHSRVGILTGALQVSVYKEFFPDNDNVTYFETQNDALKALENDKIDMYFASEYTLLIQTHYREKSGYKLNLRLNAPMYSNFGFHKDETVLCSIVGQAQKYVDVGAIETSWTNRTFDYSSKLANQRAVFMLIFSIMVLLALAGTAYLLLRNIRLGRKLKVMAHSDGLTGIFNRRYFMEQSSVQIQRELRTAGGECFIVIYDLDYFKRVNDEHGHQAGDKVLRDTSQRVKKSIRPYDLFARYGGEEFIIFMPGINKEGALIAVERLRREICGAPVEFGDKTIPVSASFGVAYAAPRNNLEKAIQYADEALYRAKEAGRNRAVFREQDDNDTSGLKLPLNKKDTNL